MFLFTQDEQRGANYVYKKTDCNSMLNWAGKQNLALQCVPGESKLTQKYAFIKNPQFLANNYETLWTYEDFILTKFRNDYVKIVDF